MPAGAARSRPVLSNTAANPAARQAWARDAVTPLYHKIFLIMRERLESGVYARDGVAPGEMDLAREFGVSRITAARALNDLAALGLVDRKRGRGTRVVTPAKDAPRRASLEGLIENLVSMGLKTQVRVLSFDDVVPPDDVRSELKLPEGALAQRVMRVRSQGGAPFSLLTTWVPEKIARTFGRDDLGATPMLSLIERAGVKVASATQTFSAAIADPAAAEALQTEIGAALLTIERTVIAETGEPVQHIRAAYRPDRYRYRMSLTREASEFGNVWADGSAP